MRRLVVAGLLLGSVAAGPAAAQTATTGTAPTTIRPDIELDKALGTTVARSGNIHVIDGGRLAGTNLFHSFAQFDLAAGDIARWTRSGGDPAAITNVVNRVTGGDPSHLFGTIDSTALPNAAFFFLNPAGIVFGAGAQVNVPAAAHFSTAAELRFADGTSFSVATPDGSTLSVAAPEAFGFVGQEGAMLVDGVDTAFLPTGATLSLSASEIVIRDSILIGGGIGLFAAGGSGTAFDLGEGGTASGAINLINTLLETEARSAAEGSIAVSGGAVAFEESTLSGFSTAAAPGGDIVVIADTVRLDGASSISTTGLDGTSAGDIGIAARAVDITDGSMIGSRSVDAGAPGSIAIEAEEIRLSNGRIVSETYGSGDSGLVLLAGSKSVSLDDFSLISTDSVGSGDSGAVAIETPRLSLSDSLISADSLGEGDAGGVVVSAQDAALVRSTITSDSYAEGDGGIVQLDIPGLLTLRELSSLRSTAHASGNSGGVLINGGSVVLDGSSIQANAFGEGDALIVGLELTGELRLENHARIASDTAGAGSAGGILIEAQNVSVHTSQIGSEAFGDGEGGLVAIHASGQISLEDGARITSDTWGMGDAGGIGIAARDLRIAGESRVSSDARGDGHGGSIEIALENELMMERGLISADVEGAGDGGDVNVSARAVAMTSGSFLSADGFSSASGSGGDVTLRADALTMSTLSTISSEARGTGNGGNVDLTIGRLAMTDRAAISSRTLGSGTAGSVTLRGGAASITDGWIDSDAFGTGDAGAVTIDLETLDLVRSRISSEAGEIGDSGTVEVKVAGKLALRSSEILTNTIGSGAAGDLSVAAETIALEEQSAISSVAFNGATGPSGQVEVAADRLSVTGGSRITTSTDNANPAGNILIDAAHLQVSDVDSAIASENSSREGGAAGNIFIRSSAATIRDGARVTTNSAHGAAGNILFDMPAESFLFLSGAAAPGTLETSSGPGTGGLIIIASPKAIVSHGGNILALGESGGANVLISTKYFIPSADRLNRVEVDGDLQFDNAIYDVSAGTVSPDLSVIDASGILRGQCPALRSGGALSQLSIRASGPFGASFRPDGGDATVAPPAGTCR